MAQATGETRREVLPKQNVVPLQDQSSVLQVCIAQAPERRGGNRILSGTTGVEWTRARIIFVDTVC